MKPEQFIREFGVEKAREVVEDAPDLSLFYDLEKQKHVLKESTSIAMAFLKNRFLPIEDLKRLVESVDRVNEHGGYLATKELLSFSIVHQEAFGKDAVSDETINSLKAAIRDHESIYRGSHA
ncbi:hypothetical protein [Acinetobacter baumannii]|uniref:hypothetical protein n=1 Tax=Acinetobacter baumannii TaxID=470 RepID=UPI000DE7A15B|nr:hypothetical protein [Acinetobacter baumannii]MCJ9045668.1 hypothetical protein [Acinetobacter baumannii]MCJ9297206.1 hypothetical protein [Acinetobacter baumannii]MCJ9399240.1 hypothetical protein [Acinetobacter baumannii]MCJ9494791.1 hypothetical protein [Acinetobacter baumannii]QLF11155.1 hypothetical protein F7R60_13515 [Acinetobacter baumannii]